MRQRRHAVVEKREIVLGADVFLQGALIDPAEALRRRPIGGEGPGVLHRDEVLQGFAAIDHLEALGFLSWCEAQKSDLSACGTGK
jgi:hypothetical protein